MRAFGFDPDDDVIAIPGFIRPPKGHDIFIELARELPEYEFMIAGGARAKGEDFEFAEQIRGGAGERHHHGRARQGRVLDGAGRARLGCTSLSRR